MIAESKYFTDITKNHFNRKLVMTKEDDEDFEKSIECWICDNTYVDGDVKVRDYCHVTGKYRSSAHINCNIIVKLNHKIPLYSRT